MGPLEKHIMDMLDGGRLRIKLNTPLAVGAAVANRSREALKGRRAVVERDQRALDHLEGQLGAFREDMRRDFKFQQSHADVALQDMNTRAGDFFDRELQLSKLTSLIQPGKLRDRFANTVVKDVEASVDRHVQETIAWMVDKERKQHTATVAYLRRGTQMTDWASSGQLVGRAAGDTADVGVARHALRFDAMRTSELDRLAESARKILQEYDTKEEANRLASRVQSSMLQTAAFEIGAGERDSTLI